MKKILYAFIISVIAAFVLNKIVYQEVSQKEKQKLLSEVLRYRHPIESVSIEYQGDSDLRILNSVLRDNKVLLLGENTHYDGATTQAKSRLIKYLHENLNYNIVLYEAGQYDSWIMNKEMNNPDMKVPADSTAGLGLFWFWWGTREAKPLMEYYKKTKASPSPIELGGFDIQFSGAVLSGRRSKLLKDFLIKNRININSFPVFGKTINELENLTYESYADKILKGNQKNKLLKEISQLEQTAKNLEKTPENVMYARYFHDMKNNLYKAWKYKTGSMPSMQFRDSLMASNLTYQIDSVYKDKKIIIWCSNIHTFADRYDKSYLPMGAYIRRKYGKASYMIDFSSYAKKNIKGNLMNKPGKLAVENIFHETKTPYFFINLRNIPENSFLKKEFVSTINQGIDQKRIWSRYFDGIFYIDTNTLLTPIRK
ncbi:erythromycin esterase family protein [Chryseobacterium oranimense]|uniref:erythromycin esterase family protein n=1 Tax=Chryseobacterium oranimense TaxID=421058 RepID=UPI0021AF4DB3|nr:erythromycin esterase family protein [Chryseobacterium oranimense]UWX58856.1 erythromycin esterase family protein [Chryseobacterium oranimense]